MTVTRIKDRAHRKSRNPASKPAYERRILEALARGMSPAHAATAAGVGRSTAYLWRQEDPAFAAKWDDAVALGIDCLESEAYRRALAGSDKLLIFLLERRRPEVWALPKANRPRGFARSHDAGKKIDKVSVVFEALSQIQAAQAARDTAAEMATKSPPALSDAQQTPMMIVGEPVPASVPAQSKK